MYRLKVKELAERRGLSQNRLSRLADVDVKVIRRIYRNPQESVTLPVLDRIAHVLKVDISELIESVPDEPPGTR